MITFRDLDRINHRVQGGTAAILEFFKSKLSHTGFADYQHQDGSTTLNVDEWTDVPNNQLGQYTTTEFLPPGITQLMDPATGWLDFTELHIGDQVHIRNDFIVTPDAGTAFISARYALGSGAGTFFLNIWDTANRGSAIAVPNMKGDVRITMSFPETILGPGKLQVKCSTGGTLVNEGSNVGVTLATPFLRR